MSVTSYAQSGEDLQIAYFVGRRSAVTYIDVGCLWPQHHSNTYYFYERGGSGLCIDPNPAVRVDFGSQRPRDLFLNCGISDRADTLTYYLHGNPVFNTFSPEVSAANERDADRRQGDQRKGRLLEGTSMIPVMTLDEAVSSTGFAAECDGRVDFVSIDVEGFELKVLAGFGFDIVRPRLVVTEYIRRGRQRPVLSELPVAQLLASHGYWLAGFTGHDLYFLDERT